MFYQGLQLVFYGVTAGLVMGVDYVVHEALDIVRENGLVETTQTGRIIKHFSVQ